MSLEIIGDRGNWNRIDSNLVDKLNKESIVENKSSTKKPNNIAPKIKPLVTPSAVGNKKDYVYVPSLGLYISEDKYLHGKNWNETQDFLHQEGRRMPTIPEFVEFLKYLRSDEGKSKVKNAQKILDEIYKVSGNWRSEWLDAKFEEFNGDLYVNSHGFDSVGKITNKSEKLASYLIENKTPGIDLDFWINNSIKQGLPSSNCLEGKLYYWAPENERVAGFFADSDWAVLDCYWDPTVSYSSLGVRYVEPRSGETV